MMLADEMRRAADTLEKVARLYGSRNPATSTWTARRLRYEADILDRPIPGDEPA